MLALVILLFAADPPKPTDNGPRATDKSPWTPKDKETVVLLGSAFIEQEARDGYLETELIRLFPNKDIRVRNLGWSGDTVHCQARSYFGPPQEGFDRLREHLKMIKPTTVICCYGANESWKGEPGIPDFRKGYEKLIDMIRETTGATVVLMTPPPFGPSVEKEANARLERYVYEVERIADGRGLGTLGIDVTRVMMRLGPIVRNYSNPPLTSDALMTDAGYAFYAEYIFRSSAREPSSMNVSVASHKVSSTGFQVDEGSVVFSPRQIMWTATAPLLPTATPARTVGDAKKPEATVRTIAFEVPTDLNSKEDWELHVDGKATKHDAVINSDKLKFWVYESVSSNRTELLRQSIIKKNALFFHRWRPANETYLYGFRKHEQGNNGVEPPQFDKLVEEAEAEIAKLKKPVPHKYELIRVEEKK